MLRTFIQFTALLQAAISAIFLVKGATGMSLKDMAELSKMNWGYNTSITKNLAGQKADTTVGSTLLFLSLVLQIINSLWPLSWNDFGINPGGVALAVVISIVIFLIGRRVSYSLHQKWYKQAEDILKKPKAAKTEIMSTFCKKEVSQMKKDRLCPKWWCTVRKQEAGWISDIWLNNFPRPEHRGKLFLIGRLTIFEKLWLTFLLCRSYVSLGHVLRGLCLTDETKERAESQLIELYVVLFHWIPLCLIMIFHPFIYSHLRYLGLQWLLWFLVLYLVAGSVLLPLRIVFVDRYCIEKEGNRWSPYSFNRSLIFVFLNYFEIIVGFAYLYLHYGLVGHSNCTNPITTIGDALYFSVVTITTLGYGDIRPITWQGRVLTSIEPIMGVILLVVIVGLFFVEQSKRRE